jgi:hypothetical protein
MRTRRPRGSCWVCWLVLLLLVSSTDDQAVSQLRSGSSAHLAYQSQKRGVLSRALLPGQVRSGLVNWLGDLVTGCQQTDA